MTHGSPCLPPAQPSWLSRKGSWRQAVPGKGPELLPAEAANVTSKASTDHESLRSCGVRSSFWGEPMPCQTPSGEMDPRGGGIRPVPRAPGFTTSHAASASQGGVKAGDTQQAQQLASQCSCTDNSPGTCQTTPLGNHGEGLDGGGMTREHHVWLAMARSNCHRRHLFAVVCPMPQSDTPWAVAYHGAPLFHSKVTLAAPETPRPPQSPSL